MRGVLVFVGGVLMLAGTLELLSFQPGRQKLRSAGQGRRPDGQV